MLKKIERKLEKQMEKWTRKKLIICQLCVVIVIVLSIVSIIVALALQISIFGIVLWIVIALTLICFAKKLFKLIQSVTDKVSQNEEEDARFTYLQKVLSYKEYRKVIYSPDVTRCKHNLTLDDYEYYEDKELIHCKEILAEYGTIYYAILTGSSVFIIIRNKEGEYITNRTVDATTFCGNYEILKE